MNVVAKIPKIYIPSVILPKSESKEMNKHVTRANIKATQNPKPSPILRPRAVVSSPDNDAMIGNINRSEEKKAKKGGHISNRAYQRKNIDSTNVKISHRTIAKQSEVSSRDYK